MSTIKVDNLQTTGGAGLYPAKAWVNFNGTGTVAIRNDGNVSSITDNGTGLYTTNFSLAMGGADYSTVVSGGGTNTFDVSVTRVGDLLRNTYSTTAVYIITVNNAQNGEVDRERALLQVTR